MKDLEIFMNEKNKKVMFENYESVYNEDIEMCWQHDLRELTKAVNRLCDILEKKGNEL